MKVEILSPAGDFTRLKWALNYGADAVYIGGYKYSLRANANNFSLSDIKEAVKYAHRLKKKVYVTVNMLFHNEDLEGLDKYLKDLYKANVDAVIVSDLAVIESIKRQNLPLEFHISTQESSTNYETVKFWENLGASRVVLARECSKEDIKEIKEKCSSEIEVFIHGAMCTSYSGRCVLSNYVTNRDSNRGGCSQVCRFTFYNNSKELFSISTKDLNMVNYIKDLCDLGVESLKIEGRMRSIYYIATVVNTYRRIVDDISMNKLDTNRVQYYTEVLKRCSNRESTPQFFNKAPGVNEQYYIGRDELTNKDFLGVVLDYDEKSKIATIEQRNYFSVGDEIEVFSPKKDAFSFVLEQIKNKDNLSVSAARHPKEILKIRIENKVEPNDILRVPIKY